MVDKSPERLDAVFRALADPTRRAMLRDLAQAPRTIGELAAPFAISLAGASKHIQMLERAGLIRRQPGAARSIQLLVQPEALPTLRPAQRQPIKSSVQSY